MKSNRVLFYILVVVSFLAISYLLAQKVFQNDTYYTIKVGESIFKNGIDMKDHFSLFPDLTYVYPHWLFDSLIYFLYSLGGLRFVYLSTIVFGFILLMTIYICSVKLGNNKYVSYLLIIFFSFFLGGYFTARAQMISYIFFVLILYSLDMLRKSKNKKYLLYLFISALVIANAHAAVWPFVFVLFLPSIVQDIIYLINKKFKLNILKSFNFVVEKSSLKLTMLAFLICLLTGFMTPNFLVPFTYYINTVKGVSMEYISEHGVVDINYAPQVYLLCFATIFLLLNKKSKVRLSDLFLIIGLYIVAFSSIKNISLLYILTIFSYARMFSSFNYKSIEPYLWCKTFMCILISVFTISLFVAYKSYVKKDYIDESSYPINASKYIKENLDLESVRIFNQYDFGSYLIYEDIPVFIDSRADLYLKEFNKDCLVFEDYFSAKSGTNYRIKFKKYNITHLLLKKTTSLYSTILSRENYKEIYSDDYFVIYELGD